MNKLSVTYPDPPSPQRKRDRSGAPGLVRSIVNWLCIAVLAALALLLLLRRA